MTVIFLRIFPMWEILQCAPVTMFQRISFKWPKYIVSYDDLKRQSVSHLKLWHHTWQLQLGGRSARWWWCGRRGFWVGGVQHSPQVKRFRIQPVTLLRSLPFILYSLGLANLFCKGPNSTYFRLCGLWVSSSFWTTVPTHPAWQKQAAAGIRSVGIVCNPCSRAWWLRAWIPRTDHPSL